MFTLMFWKSVAERSGSTFLEALLSAILLGGASTLTGVDWIAALNFAGLAAVIAVVKNVLVAKATDGSPSAGNVEKLSGPDHRAE